MKGIKIMANDTDMYNDIEYYEKCKGLPEEIGEEATSEEFVKDINSCYYFRYIEYNEQKAEEYKQIFIDKYGFWGNWY